MSYITDHPTHFNWREDVKRSVARVQNRFPFKTYANTYRDHPPGWGLDAVSVDYWGGGMKDGRYLGYRGKPIGTAFGEKVFDAIFEDPKPPDIWWIIWNGWMWTDTGGWQKAPGGPADSDPGHFNHIHVTYR